MITLNKWHLTKFYDHQVLLKKLKCIGFSPETVRCFESYLQNRNLIVSFDKSLSEPGVLNCGVPQWSSLGPTLFLLYVNGSKSAVNHWDLRLYADGHLPYFQQWKY